MRMTLLLFVVTFSLGIPGVVSCGGDGDSDSDGDSDADGDGDGDVDGDGDTDSDADGDSDTDGDTDSDVDGDGDGDTDGDADGDVDTDGDADSDGDSFDPECSSDDDCDGGMGCYLGVCRHHCTLGTCYLAPGGGYCREGFCVECLRDEQCPGTRYVCDETFSCADGTFDPTVTAIGIFYSTWHCVVSSDNIFGATVYDISEILEGRQEWGPVGAKHWWDQPEAGYYCLSRNDELLEEHAVLLRDAGIDFIFIDITNHNYIDYRSDRTTEMILEPLDRLLAVWSTIPDAPKVVPWVPIEEAGTDPGVYTIDAVLERLEAYPDMHFEYLGQPLILLTENETHPVNAAKRAELELSYTVRSMWGLLPDEGEMWSFLQRCDETPAEGRLCRQRLSTRDGVVEQIPIGTAYQATFMSVTSTATPKNRGLTFRRQFHTLMIHPEVPIATITGWNEWFSGRRACDSNPACPCETYPYGCFTDQFDVEFSRDIEPGMNEMGDYYYQLMTACIDLFRSGGICDGSHPDHLCCSEWEP